MLKVQGKTLKMTRKFEFNDFFFCYKVLTTDHDNQVDSSIKMNSLVDLKRVLEASLIHLTLNRFSGKLFAYLLRWLLMILSI